ncbi:MAG: UDP-N-acetylmuramate dehydrogenase [Gammaproteobacteria bacterium]|nr:MAG: UDP-N-acetylmuramate dehydrogenase [Gammaproteobacteria bacterium]
MPDIQSAVSLQSYNTLSLPARAEFFCRVETLHGLQEALCWARDRNYRVTVLGGGSNVVLTADVPGLVIAMGIPGIELVGKQGVQRTVRVGAGENWHQLVRTTLSRSWYGLENLSLIPGLAGAAPIQNIGAYGVELSERFHSLEAVHIQTGDTVSLSRADCCFGYRDSVFKQGGRDQYVISSMTLTLSSEPELRLDYPVLQQALAQKNPSQLTPELVSDVVCEIRRSKLPDPLDLPNVGSFFKNPVVPVQQAVMLKAEFPDMVTYPQADGNVKLAAGWLVDRAGWKGVTRGNVGVHKLQALVLINTGGCAAELLALADEIRQSVLTKFGVSLELEPRVYP